MSLRDPLDLLTFNARLAGPFTHQRLVMRHRSPPTREANAMSGVYSYPHPRLYHFGGGYVESASCDRTARSA